MSYVVGGRSGKTGVGFSFAFCPALFSLVGKKSQKANRKMQKAKPPK